jgi:hypothetical protein
MKKEDLLLVLQNPNLTKLLIDVLSKDDTNQKSKSHSLDEFLLGDGDKPYAPAVTDLRDKGHRAASNFVKEYVFSVGKKFQVWFTGHESSLRQAFERNGYRVSMNTLAKGKKYEIQIMQEIPAKKKSA